MLFATISYVISLVGVIMMYIWYVPRPSCLINIFFITWTLVLVQLMTSVSLHPKVSSFLPQLFPRKNRPNWDLDKKVSGKCWNSSSWTDGALHCLQLLVCNSKVSLSSIFLSPYDLWLWTAEIYSRFHIVYWITSQWAAGGELQQKDSNCRQGRLAYHHRNILIFFLTRHNFLHVSRHMWMFHFLWYRALWLRFLQ